jgi:hypothetical protein
MVSWLYVKPSDCDDGQVLIQARANIVEQNHDIFSKIHERKVKK